MEWNEEAKRLHRFLAKHAEVTVSAEPEELHPSDLLESQEDVEKIVKEAEWNIWAWCCVEVKVSWMGLTESNFLGGCSFDSEADFKQTSGCYDDLMDEALMKLVERLLALRKQLNSAI